MTRVCIVGGSGFIGTSIARKLDAGGTAFTIVDRSASAAFPDRVLNADIRDPARTLEAVAGDTILHLAAVHRDNVRPISLYDEVNVQGTQNLCRAAEAKGITRIIFASSVAVYGFAPRNTDETGRIDPFNEYGRSKARAEDVLRAWQAAAPEVRSLTLIRPTVVFGPGNRGNVYNLLNQIARKRFVMIGNGQNVKSLAYVENVADFFLHFLDAPAGIHTRNYRDGPDLNMNDLVSLVRARLFGRNDVGLRLPKPVGYLVGGLADLVSAATGKSLPISRQRVLKFLSDTSFSTRHGVETGFVPATTLAAAIEATLAAEFINPDPNRTVYYTE